MDERADVAIRVGPLPTRDLVARKLGETPHGDRGFARLSGSARHAAHAGRSRVAQPARLQLSPAAMRRLAVAASTAQRASTCRSAATRCVERRRDAAPAGAGGLGLARLSRFHLSPISRPGGWCRCWRNSIRATSSRSMRSSSARPGSCRRGCAPCSTSWWRMSGRMRDISPLRRALNPLLALDTQGAPCVPAIVIHQFLPHQTVVTGLSSGAARYRLLQ